MDGRLVMDPDPTWLRGKYITKKLKTMPAETLPKHFFKKLIDREIILIGSDLYTLD